MSLSIIYEYEENNIKYCKCKCDCGNYINIEKTKIKNQTNCGNCPIIKEKLHIHNFIILNKTTGNNWLCECICGREVEVNENDLINGIQKSCGCCKNYKHYRPAIKLLHFKKDYPHKYKPNDIILNLLRKH